MTNNKSDIAPIIPTRHRVWIVYEVSDCCPNLISEIVGIFTGLQDAEYHVGVYRRGAKIMEMVLE